MSNSNNLAATAVGNYVDHLLDAEIVERAPDRIEHSLDLVAAVRIEEALLRGINVESCLDSPRKQRVLRTALRRLAAESRAAADRNGDHACREFVVTAANAADALAETL